MARRKNKTIVSNSHGLMKVFIAFHVEEAKVFGREMREIKTTLEEEFSEYGVNLIYSDAVAGETVWSVTKPVLDSEEANTAFFERMSRTFTSLSRLSPHFTQAQD